MARFDNFPRSELRRNTAMPLDYERDTYLQGDTLNGFYLTAAPRKMSWWGMTYHTKGVLASLTESGNFATWGLNHGIAPLVPGEQRVVKMGTALLMEENFPGERAEPQNAMAALAGRIHFAKDVSWIDKRLQMVDEDFDAAKWTKEYIEADTMMVGKLALLGFDMHEVLKDARNAEHWMYLKNKTMTHAVALQEMETWKAQVGWLQEGTSMFVSGLSNYLLTDPTFAPSLVVPIGGGLGQAAGRAGQAASAVKGVFGTAKVLGTNMRPGLAAGRAASRIFMAPRTIHAAAAAKVGHRAALALELGTWGGAWDLAYQSERLKQSDIETDNPDLQQEFSWSELGLAVGITAGLGFMMGGRVGKLAQARKNAVMQAGGGDHSPIYYTWDNYKAQHRMDSTAVRVQRASHTLLGEDGHHVVAPFMQPKMLQEAGLQSDHVLHAMRLLQESVPNGQLRASVVQDALSSMFLHGRKTRGALRFTEDALESALERQAWAQALGRAGREAGNEVSNMQVIRKAYTYMDDELTKLERQYDPDVPKATPVGGATLKQGDDLLLTGGKYDGQVKVIDVKDDAVQLLHDDGQRRWMMRARAEKLMQENKLRPQGFSGKAISNKAHWQDALKGLRISAEMRVLSDAEQVYLQKTIRELKKLGVPNPLKGMKDRRGLRFRDGSMAKPLAIGGDSPIAKIMNKLAKADNEIDELLKARKAGGRAPKGDITRDLKNARNRLKYAQNQMRKLNEEAVTELEVKAKKVRQILEENKDDPRLKSSKGRQAMLRDLFKAVDFNAAELMEDATFVGGFIEAMGLGKMMRYAALSGTGQEKTLRSAMGILRELSSEFDNSKLKLDDLIPNSNKQHLTMETVKRQLDQKMGLLNSAYNEISKRRLGAGLNVRKHWRLRREFDQKVVQHIAGKTSTDADVIAMGKMWREIADEIETIGLEIGEFKHKRANFFPRRVKIGHIMKNQDEFTEDLHQFFLKKWMTSDTAHLDSLVEAGYLEKVLDTGTGHNVWMTKARDGLMAKQIPATTKVTDLQKLLGIDEVAYRKLLTTPMEGTDITPMYRSAQNATDHLMGRDTYFTTPAGHKIRVHGGRIKHELERQLDDDILFDPDMEKWMDFRFTDNAKQYLDSTGFSVMNNQRHANRWGIKGLQMEETITALKAEMDDLVNSFSKQQLLDMGTDRQTLKTAAKVGAESLREKLYLMEGRLPTLSDHTNGLREFITQAGQAAAGWVYGGGIGQTIMGTEGIASLFGRIYGPSDVIKRAMVGMKALGAATYNVQARRELFQTFGLASRQFRHFSMERLTGASHYSTYQYGILPRLLAPWAEFFDTLLGRTAPHPGQPLGRVASTGVAFMKAGAANAMQVGGMDMWTTFSRLVQVQTMADQWGRFFKAAEKTAVLLEENAGALRKAFTDAEALALAAGKSAPKARVVGKTAEFKVWKGLVRKGGFGSHWEVAEGMARHQMLQSDKLAVLRKAGMETKALNEGFFKTMDFTEIAGWQGASKAEVRLFSEALRDMTSHVEQTINKRISEPSILQKMTGKESRTGMGMLHQTMSGWARSAFDNIIMDTAQMPWHVGAAMVGTYLFGETMSRILRDMMNGRTPDEIYEEFDEDKTNWIGRAVLNFPLLGMYTPGARQVWDAFTEDSSRRQHDSMEGAGSSAYDSLSNMVFDTAHALSPWSEDTGGPGIFAQRTAYRLIPGSRSWWFMIGDASYQQLTGKEGIQAAIHQGRERFKQPTQGTLPERFKSQEPTGPLPGVEGTPFAAVPELPQPTFDLTEDPNG